MDERFKENDLDPSLWFPYYLPHWSSRAASRATYEVGGGLLRLSIPSEQGLWCPGLHEEPLRVSCIQSGTLDGQQPFREGLQVAEPQATFWGYTPLFGHIEVRMRGLVTGRSMFAFWLAGIEEEPDHSGEICVAEVFGEGLGDGTAEVGTGIKSLGDPGLHQEFEADAYEIDVARFHTYAVDWRPDGVDFLIDDEIVRSTDQSPDYPMQLMLGVFDFPDRPGVEGVPEMHVSHVSGRPSGQVVP